MRLPLRAWTRTLSSLGLRPATPTEAERRRRRQSRRSYRLESLERREMLAADFGEIGTLTFNQPNENTWQTVQMARDYLNPVVVAGPLSVNGPNPAMVRVRNVDAANDTFQIQIDEWNYQDGSHNVETFTYMVVEAGTHVLPDGTLGSRNRQHGAQ